MPDTAPEASSDRQALADATVRDASMTSMRAQTGVTIAQCGGEIFWRDRFQRRRLEPEHRRKRTRAHAGQLHRREVVATHQRPGQVLEHRGLQSGKRWTERKHGSVVPRELANVGNQLAQAVGSRPAEVVALTVGTIVLEGVRERSGHVTDEYRLESSVRAGERHDDRQALKAGEHVEKRILTAEDDRGPEYCPGESRLGDDAFGLSFAAQISAGPLPTRVERAHVQEALHTCRAAGGDDLARKFDVHLLEVAATCLVEDAYQVQYGGDAAHQLMQRCRVVYVSLDHGDR